MITFTAPDNSSVKIDGSLVVRARRAVYGESISEGAQTRIDWAYMQLVKEPLSEVVIAIKAELPTFDFLTGRDGSQIWFNARKAVGPMPLTDNQRIGGARSAIKIMGYRQYVTETEEEVRALLSAHGGTVLP